MHNEPTALARRAFLGERLHKPLTDALARHLHQAKRRDLGHLVLRAVARQAFEQAPQHQIAVGGHDHIHVIDHDHAADVAQAQLACDLFARLEVAARHGLFERLALADEAAGVHVDRGHGLGAVDHDGAAARQVHLAFHALAQLRVDLPLVEHILALMLGRIPLLQLLAQVGGHGLEVFLDARVHAVALHDHLAEVVVEDVAHHADRHVRLALQELGALAVLELLTLGLNLLPLVQQHLQILGDRLLRGALGRSADDHAHVLRRDLRDDRLEAAALTAAELAAHTGHATGRHEHQEAAGERHLARQARALVADRVLGDLHQHRVAGAEREFDATWLAVEARGIPVHLTRIQHAVARLADVDERGFHARQHVLHAAQIDVAHRGNFLDIGDVMLHEHVVFEHGDLRVAVALAHHHQAVHVFAARQEVLLEQLVLAAALAAVVAAALLLRLEARGALHIGDLVDVLLLARAAGCGLLLRVLAVAAAATAARDRGLLVVFGAGLGGLLVLLLLSGLMVGAAAATATAHGRLAVPALFAAGVEVRFHNGLGLFVVFMVALALGVAGDRLVDRRIRDVVEHQIFFDLLHFGGGAALLRVHAAVGAAARRGLVDVFHIVEIGVIIDRRAAAATARFAGRRLGGLGRLVAFAAACAAATARGVLVVLVGLLVGFA